MAKRIALVIANGQVEQLQDGDVLIGVFPPGHDGDVLILDSSHPSGVSWGLPRNKNAFIAAVPAGVSTIAIKFPIPFPSGVIPVVVCTPMFQTVTWVTDITNKQFILNIKSPTAFPSIGRVNIIAMRTQ